MGISDEIIGIISNVTPVQIFEGTILKNTLEKFLKASLKEVLLTFQNCTAFYTARTSEVFLVCCSVGVLYFFNNGARPEGLKESFKKLLNKCLKTFLNESLNEF